MNIFQKNIAGTEKIIEVQWGTVLTAASEDTYFIKINRECECVDLKTGKVVRFNNDAVCTTYPKARLVLE
jgi:hypothetical protein